MKRIKLICNKSEIGAGTRGSSLGIDALKVAAWNSENTFFTRYPLVLVEDQNYLLDEPNETNSAIRIKGVLKVYETIANEVKKTLEQGEFPFILAADHASAGGTIAGIKMAFPEEKLGVIWIDAHGDLHSPYTSPSGNMHGMPLASALNQDNTESKIREVEQETIRFWEILKQLGQIAPKVEPENLVFFGLRDIEEPERRLIEKNGVRSITVEEYRNGNSSSIIHQVKKQLKSCDLIYISFDVDSMDPDKVSYGTGTPVPNGFLPDEIKEILHALIQMEKLCCFEIVEINPTLDNKKNKMAETALNIIDVVSKSIENK